MSIPTVRFAPSPTGRLHIGNARPALINALFARRHGGRFILRFDDTDVARSQEVFARSIEVDLAWLGITPDLTVRQSDRFDLYAKACQTLREAGRLYPCFETPDELGRRRRRQLARGKPPIYDRAALDLTADDIERLESEGRTPHWRFRLDGVVLQWRDLVRGDSHVDCASLSDPVLVREDGTYLYTLPSVVDDIDLGVTHVIRGEDHVTNTAVQIQIMQALGAGETVPAFGHNNLLTDASGEGLSKRSGALSLAGLRDDEIEAMAVAAMAVLTGSSQDLHPVANLEELVQTLDLEGFSRSAARFDPAELRPLSARTLHLLPYEAVRDRLTALDIAGHKAEAFWLAVRGNLTRFSEVADWWRVVAGDITAVVEDAAFLESAARVLPAEPWDPDTWAAWTRELKSSSGRKGKALFHPLRLALTGREQGPELAVLLPLIGRATALARLSAPSS